MNRTFHIAWIGLVLSATTAWAQSAAKGTLSDADSGRLRDGAKPDRGSAIHESAGRHRDGQNSRDGDRSRTGGLAGPADDRRFAGPGNKPDRDSRAGHRRGHSDPVVLVVVNTFPAWQGGGCGPVPASYADTSAGEDTVFDAGAYYQPAYEWGADLKEFLVRWDQFVPYLKEYIVAAPAAGREAFRAGFIAGYGANAEATYDYAMRQACRAY